MDIGVKILNWRGLREKDAVAWGNESDDRAAFFGEYLTNLVACAIDDGFTSITHPGSNRSKLPRVRNLTRIDRTDLPRVQRHHRRRAAVQRYKFDFATLPIRVEMDHRSDIPCFEPVSRNIGLQNNAIMLCDHDDGFST